MKINPYAHAPLFGHLQFLLFPLQEAQVMQRVAELRKDGMWSARRLPKVSEPPRQKAHWDYLLEEMQWLAADFAQERKWKKAGARKVNYIHPHCNEQVRHWVCMTSYESTLKLASLPFTVSVH